MTTYADPFASIVQYERELKRTALCEEIKQRLKLEAYDDSPIGHEFVKHYEKQLPGIITAASGDHTFTTATTEENVNVIMEAIDSSMALKGGLIAAALMIVYKIIKVIMGNKSFGSGSGGGRGTPTYVKSANERLKELKEEYIRKQKEAKEATRGVPKSAIDEDTPIADAAKKLNDTYTKYIKNPDGTISEEKKAVLDNADAIFKSLEDMDEFVTNLDNLPAFFLVKDESIFLGVMNRVNDIVKMLNNYTPSHACDDIEGFVNIRPLDKMISETGDKVLLGIAKNLEKITGMNPETILRSNSIDISAELRNETAEMLATTYGEGKQNEAAKFLPNEAEIIKDINDPHGVFIKRSEYCAEFNESFMLFLEDNKELEDSKFYAGFQHLSELVLRARDELSDSGQGIGSTTQTSIKQRLNLTESVIRMYVGFLLKTLVTFRRQTDLIDSFREKNIEALEKMNKVLDNYIDACKSGSEGL